jgi:hemoglobin-like flavoprotein
MTEEEDSGLTLKQKAEKIIERFWRNLYLQHAKAKGGRDFNKVNEAKALTRSTAEAKSIVDRKTAEDNAEAAAKVIWS